MTTLVRNDNSLVIINLIRKEIYQKAYVRYDITTPLPLVRFRTPLDVPPSLSISTFLMTPKTFAWESIVIHWRVILGPLLKELSYEIHTDL